MTFPIATFRVYPDCPTSLFVRVSIYDDKRAMYRAARRVVAPPFGALFVMRNPEHAQYKRDRMVGEALFHLGRIDEGAVAHELLHATLAWAERVRIRVKPDPRRYRTLGLPITSEERICTAHERMMNQFFDRARALGLVP